MYIRYDEEEEGKVVPSHDCTDVRAISCKAIYLILIQNSSIAIPYLELFLVFSFHSSSLFVV